MKAHSKQSGLTLVEIMIALVLGIIVMGAVITIFVTTVKSSSENIRMVHLNQELRFLMGLMSDELKRAGYSEQPADLALPRDPAFREALNWDPDYNCLRYAYDVNGNGSFEPNNESFAFQWWPLDAPDHIRWGQGVTSDTCGGGVWQEITHPATAEIDGFDIDDVCSPSVDVAVHTIRVSLTGSVGLVPGRATRTVEESIRVRNDRMTACP